MSNYGIKTALLPASRAQVRTLENGLEIIVLEDRSAPVVSVQAWVRAGSCTEGPLTGSGVSHLLEHMVFKGTAVCGPSELARRVQAIGGYMNAYTSFDRTVYYIDAPAEGCEEAIDVITDLTARAIFPEEEYEKEKDVIRREIDMGQDDPDSRHSELTFETIFTTHPMGQPIIGHLPLFNSVTRAQMMEYYHQHYAPNNIFFVVVGAITVDEVEQMISARWKEVPRRFVPLDLVPTEPPQLGRRDKHIEFPTELTKLSLCWRIPGLTHEDIPALEVLNEILGSGRSSRLFRQIREEKKLAHAVSSYCYSPPPGGVFFVSLSLDPEQRDAATEAVLSLIDEVKQRGVMVSEIAKAQRRLLSDELDDLTTMKGQAASLGSDWHAARNLNFTRDMLAMIDQVTPTQVQQVAIKYFTAENLTVTSVNPINALKSPAIGAQQQEGHQIIKKTLDHGLTLLMKIDRRVPLIVLQGSLRGGSLAESEATQGLTNLFSRCLLKGTTTRTAADIASEIEERGGSIGSESGGSSWSIGVQVMKPDFAFGAELLADVLLRPAFSEAEVEREKEAQLAAIKATEDRLTSVAFREFRRTLFGAHPFALERIGTPESLKNLTPQVLRDFHQKVVKGGNLVLSVFGDIDPDEVEREISRSFADLPPGERLVSPMGLSHRADLATQTVEVQRDKKQAVLVVGFPTPELYHPDRAALDILDEACSDMASRLFLRIREEHGLAYYTGSSQVLGMAPGAFTFYLGTAPEQLDQAQHELMSEIKHLATAGLSDDEFLRVRQSYLGKTLIQEQSPGAQARLTALDELYGAGYDHHEKMIAQIKALTASEVRTVAKKYFADQPHIIVRLFPPSGQA